MLATVRVSVKEHYCTDIAFILFENLQQDRVGFCPKSQ